MNVMHMIISLLIGTAIGTMDFTMAKSITRIVRLVNPRTGQAILVAGFTLRMGAIGILLWTMSRANNVNFLAMCIGLLAAFTVLTLGHAIKSIAGTVWMQKQLSDRR